MISIYTEKITPRIQYIFEHVFGVFGGEQIEFTTNLTDFQEQSGSKLNYSTAKSSSGFQVVPAGFLHETGIKDFEPKPVGEGKELVLFRTDAITGKFDIFSAAFYCLSRYEEYLPHRRDQHNRFDPSESWATKAGVLTLPMVDIWVRQFLADFGASQNCHFKTRTFRFTSTIDVDSCYIYKDKGLMRSLGALTRSLLNGDVQSFKERLSVIMGHQSDPHDTFDYLNQFHAEKNIDLIYFFLVADYGHNDKNVSLSKRSFQQLIKGANDYAQVGLHPSYASFAHPEKLRTEVDRLQEVVHRNVKQSRQHFLRIRLPGTYRRLQEVGITDEHTMGYPSALGFRASTCTAFRFYDLDQEQPSKLVAHPFALMEATLKYYLNVDHAQAMSQFKPIIDAVKAVNGHLITVWHSEAFSDYQQWKGWRGTYEEMIAYILDEPVK